MKIEGSYKPSASGTGDVKSRGPREAGAKEPVSNDSTVDLSPLASQLQHVEGTLSGVSEVDSVKVGELKQAISEGRFRVDPEKVADGLIQSVRDMLSAQSLRT